MSINKITSSPTIKVIATIKAAISLGPLSMGLSCAMPSALRPAGSTRQWRRLRVWAAYRLAASGSMPCTRCGEPIAYGERFDLDHLVPRALGGTDGPSNLGVAHPACNRKATPRLSVVPTPSRRW